MAVPSGGEAIGPRGSPGVYRPQPAARNSKEEARIDRAGPPQSVCTKTETGHGGASQVPE